MDKMKRVAALLVVVCLIALYVATFVMALMGSEYVMGMIWLDVIVPVLMWGIWMIARLFRRRGEELREEESRQGGRQ